MCPLWDGSWDIVVGISRLPHGKGTQVYWSEWCPAIHRRVVQFFIEFLGSLGEFGGFHCRSLYRAPGLIDPLVLEPLPDAGWN